MYYGERLNSINHLVGAVFALMAFGSLLTVGFQSGKAFTFLGFAIFGFSLVLLYSMSTLYHSFKHPGRKKLFKLLDHVSIYILIAGTYTPLMLVSVGNWTILGLVWGFAVLGTLSEIFLSGKTVKICQVITYLAMGWICGLDMGSIQASLPVAGFNWLLAGGLVYTVGIIFYVLDKLNRLTHAHGIWHFFVLIGSACHFICVIGYVR